MAKYDIKLVVSDIDGTLLPKGGNISEGSRKAVAECRRRGINFALASGRWFPTTLPIAEAVGCQGPLIVSGGGCVITIDGEILQEFTMDEADARRTYDIVKDCGGMITSYSPGAIFRLNAACLEKHPPEKTAYIGGDVWEVVDDDVSRFETEGLAGPYKMEVYSDDPELLRALWEKLEAAGLSVCSSTVKNIEIASPGGGKGQAVKWLAEYLGIEKEQVMAFGDHVNDIDMLEAAGVGVAMGNGEPEVKKAADLVAPPCADDGLARMLRDMVFDGEE
ncbi:MAG: HAD family phosphatase [Clostridia bacterium]|nr:HAD family phosphatase [Clostridia bacterium]